MYTQKVAGLVSLLECRLPKINIFGVLFYFPSATQSGHPFTARCGQFAHKSVGKDFLNEICFIFHHLNNYFQPTFVLPDHLGTSWWLICLWQVWPTNPPNVFHKNFCVKCRLSWFFVCWHQKFVLSDVSGEFVDEISRWQISSREWQLTFNSAVRYYYK